MNLDFTFSDLIAEVMPPVGSDLQRGGWYDVVEREIKPGGKDYRFVWHDRKAWWQQEQAILAYLILHGILRDLKKPLASRKPGGLGVLLALESVDKLLYERTNNRNKNIFVVNRQAHK